MRVRVVGAGVFGTTAALELARRGHAVELLDQGPIPHPDAASTDLSKLVRADYGDDLFYRDLMLEALPRWRAWNARFGRPLFHEVGLHVISANDGRRAIGAAAPLAPCSFEADSLAALQSVDPGLVEPFADIRAESPRWAHPAAGYRSVQAGWAESGAVVAALVGWCREAGVEVRPHTPVALDDAAADVTVVACGTWLPVLLPELADRVVSVGQPVLHFRPADPERFTPPRFLPWCCDIAQTGWYGFPANADGIVKVANHGPGHPTDPTGPREVPPTWEHVFRTFLGVHLPELADAPLVGTRLCLYADTFDGDLWIGRHPDRPLVVAGGGSGHGFKFAPVLGELTANAVEGRADPRLDRLRWRTLSTRRTERARHTG